MSEKAEKHRKVGKASGEPGKASHGTRTVRVCKGTGCIMSGALDVAAAFEAAIDELGAAAAVVLTQSGCRGRCEQGPLVSVMPDDILYVSMTPEKATRVVSEHLLGGSPVVEYFTGAPDKPVGRPGDIPFFALQHKIVLGRCGMVDPEDIDECIAYGAYSTLAKVLGVPAPAAGSLISGAAEGMQGAGGSDAPREAAAAQAAAPEAPMSPEQVIEEVTASGLRGRGGAGFPTGLKWRLCREAAGPMKYVVCNGDEGDPGAFMDRSIMEGDPHAVIEGMIIGAYAIGAEEGFVYVRTEYPLAVRRMRLAIEQARARSLLGQGILGTGVSLDLYVKEGAGAFVCGEETALMQSIEGKRGMPRVRPPFPAVSGLWGRPTNINNVETWASIGWILDNGGAAYRAIGTEESHGTKVFAITGKVVDTGLVEVPMGTTPRHVIFDIAGGIKDGRTFKAVQIGGPSGGCLPESCLDLPIEYKTLTEAGAIVGSGGMVVVDETTCMVDLARYFLSFTQSESCGKCVPCRIGTKRMLEILTRITEGQGRPEDIEELRVLAADVKTASLCGLGQTAPNPLLTTLRYFEDEYVEHVRDGVCRAAVCKALIDIYIDPEACTACKACVKACPVGCIAAADDGASYVVDSAQCTRCKSCFAACRYDAIRTRPRERVRVT